MEGSLEVKLPNFRRYGQMERQGWEESERRRAEKRKRQKKEDAAARKGRKFITKHVLSNDLWICVAPEGPKVGSLKRRVRRHRVRWQMSKKNYMRSTCRSQNAQITPFSEHFWKMICRKSAGCCGPKKISNSKLLDAPMSFCVVVKKKQEDQVL